MSVSLLKASKEDLARQFSSLKSGRDIAGLLEVNYSLLTYLLYRSEASARYVSFSISKRSGGVRLISSPNRSIKILQAKLNEVLQVVYRPKSAAHGFILGRSIVTNARPHASRRYILNVDLSDFFGTINFGRVRGMLMAAPYRLPAAAATVLAQICCHANGLPQGAPTSPIISNMICAKLDTELLRLAKKHACWYSRYADDITFSTNKKQFPDELGYTEHSMTMPGRALREVIESNGFSINPAKVYLRCRNQRQEVTGVIVNSSPNVRRTLLRQVRAMLHAWEKWGLEKAEEEFRAKYDKKHSRSSAELRSFKRVLLGKISYIRAVRGFDDPAYIRLQVWYNKLDPGCKIRPRPSLHERILDSLWVLESEGEFKSGTGFLLEGYGLITCNHVLAGDTLAHRASDVTRKYKVELISSNDAIDLAILKLEEPVPGTRLLAAGERVEIGQPIILAGFPDYRLGDSGHIAKGEISSFQKFSGIDRFRITAHIVSGNSGGPVMNAEGKVLGIAVTGAESWQSLRNTANYGVIPVSALNNLSGSYLALA